MNNAPYVLKAYKIKNAIIVVCDKPLYETSNIEPDVFSINSIENRLILYPAGVNIIENKIFIYFNEEPIVPERRDGSLNVNYEGSVILSSLGEKLPKFSLATVPFYDDSIFYPKVKAAVIKNDAVYITFSELIRLPDNYSPQNIILTNKTTGRISSPTSLFVNDGYVKPAYPPVNTEMYVDTFDNHNNQLSHTTPTGDGWTATYDDRNNQLTWNNSDGFSWIKTFDLNNNQLTYKETPAAKIRNLRYSDVYLQCFFSFSILEGIKNNDSYIISVVGNGIPSFYSDKLIDIIDVPVNYDPSEEARVGTTSFVTTSKTRRLAYGDYIALTVEAKIKHVLDLNGSAPYHFDFYDTLSVWISKIDELVLLQGTIPNSADRFRILPTEKDLIIKVSNILDGEFNRVLAKVITSVDPIAYEPLTTFNEYLQLSNEEKVNKVLNEDRLPFHYVRDEDSQIVLLKNAEVILIENDLMHSDTLNGASNIKQRTFSFLATLLKKQKDNVGLVLSPTIQQLPLPIINPITPISPRPNPTTPISPRPNPTTPISPQPTTPSPIPKNPPKASAIVVNTAWVYKNLGSIFPIFTLPNTASGYLDSSIHIDTSQFSVLAGGVSYKVIAASYANANTWLSITPQFEISVSDYPFVILTYSPNAEGYLKDVNGGKINGFSIKTSNQ